MKILNEWGRAGRMGPEKVLTKTIRRVRDFEDRILCPRTMATYAFFRDNFFF